MGKRRPIVCFSTSQRSDIPHNSRHLMRVAHSRGSNVLYVESIGLRNPQLTPRPVEDRTAPSSDAGSPPQGRGRLLGARSRRLAAPGLEIDWATQQVAAWSPDQDRASRNRVQEAAHLVVPPRIRHAARSSRRARGSLLPHGRLRLDARRERRCPGGCRTRCGRRGGRLRRSRQAVFRRATPPRAPQPLGSERSGVAQLRRSRRRRSHRALARPVLLTAGTLESWLSADVLAEVARLRPAWSLVFAGPVKTNLDVCSSVRTCTTWACCPTESSPAISATQMSA